MDDVAFDPSASYDPAVCSYCGSDSHRTIVSGPTVPIIACNKCGLMRQGWVAESVKSKPIFIDYAGGVERFWRQKAEKEEAHKGDFLKIADRLEQFLPNKGKLLEIGCAMGTTLNGFQKRGWEVLGVEPEKWSADIARSKYGLEVICAPFQEAGLAKDSFDAIILLHVIEHVPNPFRALCDMIDFIRPGGYLVLETPRYDTPTFKILSGRERSVIADHLHYFTRKSMLMICRDAGFEVAKMEAVGRTVTVDRLVFYLSKSSCARRAPRGLSRKFPTFHASIPSAYISIFTI